MIVGHYAAALALNSVEYVRLWLKADMAAPEIDVCFTPGRCYEAEGCGLIASFSHKRT